MRTLLGACALSSALFPWALTTFPVNSNPAGVVGDEREGPSYGSGCPLGRH